MNENEKKTGEWRGIIGGIVLIVVLFVGIKLIFWGLGEVIGQRDLDQNVVFSQSSATGGSESPVDAPRYCVHCGKELPESFAWGQFCPYCGEKVE